MEGAERIFNWVFKFSKLTEYKLLERIERERVRKEEDNN